MCLFLRNSLEREDLSRDFLKNKEINEMSGFLKPSVRRISVSWRSRGLCFATFVFHMVLLCVLTWRLQTAAARKTKELQRLVLLDAEPNVSFTETPLTASPITPPLYATDLLAFSRTGKKNPSRRSERTRSRPARHLLSPPLPPLQLKAC